MRLTLGLITTIVFLLIPFRRAEACGAPECFEPARVAPAPGESIPANASVIVLVPQELQSKTKRFPKTSLLDADGGEIAHVLSPGFNTLTIWPRSQLSEGSYLLRFGETCQFGPLPPDAGSPFESVIQIGPEAPLPKTIGELNLLETTEEDFGPSNGCGGPSGVNAIARFGISPSPELVPWLPLTQFSLKVDDAPWGFLTEGLLEPDGHMGRDVTQPLGSRLSRVHALCPFQPDGGFGSDPGLRVGRHVAKLEAGIVGTNVQISASPVEFSLVCQNNFPPGDGPGPLEPLDEVAESCGCGATGMGTLGSLFLLVIASRLAKRTHDVPPPDMRV